MEALTFMKSWLSNPNNKPRREIKISDSTNASSTTLNNSKFDLYEEDDSFFELEISNSDFSLINKNKNTEETQTAPFSVSKSKILPFVDIVSRPHSPITLLKSAPKFRAFSFKKSKPIESEKSKSPSLTKESSRSLNVRFKIEDSNINESFRKTASIARVEQKDDTVFDDSASPASSTSSSTSSSKRFFSLIKPFYTKTSKKQSNFNSASSSPLKQRNSIRSVRRQLGKSRSASATVGVMSPAKRIDESFQVQQDGIQSAILHCKKSFHGLQDSSLLSRSTSESSSQEKLSTSSSEDSYLFSRIASDSMSEKSMDNSLSSIKEQREKISE